MTCPPPDRESAFPTVVLAIDPGSAKCGLAVVGRRTDGRTAVLHREVAERADTLGRVLALSAAQGVETVLVGNATGGAALAQALVEALPPSLPVHTVDEAFTSQRARRRFLEENPARGIARLLPMGFRTPSRPYDDYVAVLLAEEFLAAR